MTLRVRHIAADDCHAAFCCANDPLTRRMSFRGEPIAWHEHVAWFARRIADVQSPYVVVVAQDGVRVAFARFDRVAAAQARVSFVVVPEQRGRDLASAALALATRAAARAAKLEHVVAQIKTVNEASLRAFARAGYVDATPAQHAGEAVVWMRWRARPDGTEINAVTQTGSTPEPGGTPVRT